LLVTVNNRLILEIEIVHDLSCHPIIHDTTAAIHVRTSKYPVGLLAKNDILGSRLIACCKLAPTLARKCDVIITSSIAMNT